MAKKETKKKNNTKTKKEIDTNKKENSVKKIKNKKEKIKVEKKETKVKSEKNKLIKNIIDIIKKNKYIFIGIIIVILISIIILCIVNSKEELEPMEMEEAINIVDYKKLSTRKSKSTIYKKYNLEKYTMCEAKNDVTVHGIDGKLLFLRSDSINANIFQIKKEITILDENGVPALTQVSENIAYLKSKALSYMGLERNAKPIEEKLTGKSKSKFELPLRESIYIEKREYSATYQTTDGDKYDLNFYMDGDYLVCEFVKFLNLDKKEKK